MSFIQKTYYYMKYTLYILYIISFIGIWNNAPQYISYLDYFIKVLVSSVLIFYFNPISNYQFNKFHKDIAFDAGILLLLSLSLNTFVNNIKSIYSSTISNNIR
jgi:hypothetical protein